MIMWYDEYINIYSIRYPETKKILWRWWEACVLKKILLAELSIDFTGGKCIHYVIFFTCCWWYWALCLALSIIISNLSTYMAMCIHRERIHRVQWQSATSKTCTELECHPFPNFPSITLSFQSCQWRMTERKSNFIFISWEKLRNKVGAAIFICIRSALLPFYLLSFVPFLLYFLHSLLWIIYLLFFSVANKMPGNLLKGAFISCIKKTTTSF